MISSLPGAVLTFSLFCAHFQTGHCSFSAESQGQTDGSVCQRQIAVPKHPLAWIIYHETPPTTAPGGIYVVKQHWKEFQPSPCLVSALQTSAEERGRSFVIPNIPVLSMLEQLRREDGVDQVLLGLS